MHACAKRQTFSFTQSQAQIYMTCTHKIALNELFKFLENENNIFDYTCVKSLLLLQESEGTLSGQNW